MREETAENLKENVVVIDMIPAMPIV